MSASFLLTLCFLLAIPSATVADHTSVLTTDPQAIKNVEKPCSRTQKPELCSKSLITFPESATAGPHQLAGLAIRFAANQGMQTSGHLADMVRELEKKESIQQCVQECSDRFSEAVDLLDTTTASLDAKDYKHVHIWVTAAQDTAKICIQGCKECGVKAEDMGVVQKKVDDFLDLCSIALVLAKHDH
nr:daylily invertase inhibitor [Hemerocallis fulva]